MRFAVTVAFAEAVTLVAALGGLLQGVAAAIILVGGVCGAIPLIWRYGVRPVRRFVTRMAEAHAVLLGDSDSPGLTDRLQATDERLSRIEGAIDVIAEAEGENVRSAIAQFQRRRPPGAAA